MCSGGLHVAPNWDRATEPLQWHISYGIFIGLIAKKNISIFITVICILVPADRKMAFVGINSLLIVLLKSADSDFVQWECEDLF